MELTKGLKLLFSLILAFTLVSLSNIVGAQRIWPATTISAPVRPGDTLETFPSAHSSELLGGLKYYETIVERDSLYSQRRTKGTIVYVADSNKFYSLKDGITNSHWIEFPEFQDGKGTYDTLVVIHKFILALEEGAHTDTSVVMSNDTLYWRVLAALFDRTDGHLYPKTISDSLSLGINNPSEMFEVAGDAIVREGLAVNMDIASVTAQLEVGGTDGSLGITSSASSQLAWLFIRNDISKDLTFRVYGSGRTGTILSQALAASSFITNSGHELTIGTIGQYDFNLGTHDTTRMTIDKDGNVGIGTDAPTHALEIVGNTYTNGTHIQGTGTIADNDATPDISGADVWTYGGSANSVTITDLDNPVIDAVYTIIGNSDVHTVTINDGGNFNLTGNLTLGADDNVKIYVQADNDYIQVSPLVNN